MAKNHWSVARKSGDSFWKEEGDVEWAVCSMRLRWVEGVYGQQMLSAEVAMENQYKSSWRLLELLCSNTGWFLKKWQRRQSKGISALAQKKHKVEKEYDQLLRASWELSNCLTTWICSRINGTKHLRRVALSWWSCIWPHCTGGRVTGSDALQESMSLLQTCCGCRARNGEKMLQRH